MTKLTAKLKKAQYANIIKKAAAGKILTDREMEVIEEADAEIESPVRKDFIVEVAAIANFFDVSVMTISNYNKMGMPKHARGRYDLKSCFKWWLENIVMPKDSTSKAKDHHERYMIAKADNEELKRDKWKEILVNKSSVVGEFAARAADLKTTLRAYRYRMAPILEGKSAEEIAHILGAENDRLLDSFCRNGKYIDSDAAPAPAEKKPRKVAKKKPVSKKKVKP